MERITGCLFGSEGLKLHRGYAELDRIKKEALGPSQSESLSRQSGIIQVVDQHPPSIKSLI